MFVCFLSKFLIEIETDLKALNVTKVYLFDPKSLSTKDINNSFVSIFPFEVVQLYERLEQYPIRSTKPIPYNLKGIIKKQKNENELHRILTFFSLLLSLIRFCLLHFYFRNNGVTKSSCY